VNIVPKQEIKSNNQLEFIFIKTDGKNKFSKIFLNDILYVESLQNYVCIHTTVQKIITHSSLKNVIVSLPQNEFVQIHKSHVISLKQIVATDSFSVFINNKELPIGATFKDAFFERIGNNKI
jgi:two-component system LytT family response regulator